MIPVQTFESYPIFGDNAICVQPDNAKYSNGFIEGDVYPAEWVNWAWAKNTKGITDANTGLNSIEKELNTMLTCAGISPSSCQDCADQIYTAMMCKINACVGTAAPKAHASTATTYGVGTADCYGHLKISDTYTEVLASCTGVAASQKAIACVYSVANGKAAVGNTAGCALGTAAAGTATTAARSDHVHPKQTDVLCLRRNDFSSTGLYWSIPLWSSCNGDYVCQGRHNCLSFCLNANIKGVLKTDIFCGSLEGNATTATCSCYVYRNVTSADENHVYQLMLAYSNTSVPNGSAYVSDKCSVTFVPQTGVLTTNIFSGAIRGTSVCICLKKTALSDTCWEFCAKAPSTGRWLLFGNTAAISAGWPSALSNIAEGVISFNASSTDWQCIFSYTANAGSNRSGTIGGVKFDYTN